MDAYLARQPIFNARRQVVGYELLYRDGENTKQAQFIDGVRATCRVLSDAITVFGLQNLTNGKPAYVNFPDELVYNDFVLLSPPEEIIVELLEDTKVTDQLIEKVLELKEKGYQLALDDYVGDERFDPLLPIVDIIKVDFRLTDRIKQAEIAKRLQKYKNLTLLAEKVETIDDFKFSVKAGYDFFQGYFFAKPDTLRKRLPTLSSSIYVRLLTELNHPEGVDFDRCAKIIYTDVVLTYRLFQRVRTLHYYRGNPITAIGQALVMMGTTEVRRWIVLALARDNNVAWSDELVRQANLRGVFARRLMSKCRPREEPETGFLLGMFSMLDQILGISLLDILKDIKLPQEMEQALLGTKDTFYTALINYVLIYETGNQNLLLPDIGLHISDYEVFMLYMESVQETDSIFGMLEGSKRK